jgi:hypothetical protein
MPECTIDMFEAGTLTISSTRTGEIVQMVYPGEWLHATVYDLDDYPLFWFSPDEDGKQEEDPQAPVFEDEPEPARKLTCQERLEAMADNGTDTWAEYYDEC